MKFYQPNGLGVDSTALLILLTEAYEKGEFPEFESVYVCHGGDGPWTYENLDQVRDAGYNIKVLKPTVQGFNDIYEFYYHEKLVPPVFIGRSCSWKWKIIPLRKYYKKKGEPYTVFVGLDATEKHRVRPSPWKKATIRYPLIEWGITRHKCKKIIQDAGLKIPKKSGCYFCPFQSKESWMVLHRDYPEYFEKACQLDENSPNMKLYESEKGARSLREIPPAPPTLFDLNIGCKMCVFGIPVGPRTHIMTKADQE